LVFVGGQTATSNPKPFTNSFDFIALEDGEKLLPEIGLVIEEGKTNNLSEEDLLLELSQVPGVYVTRFYDLAAEDSSVYPKRHEVFIKIVRRAATSLPAYSIGLVPFIETIHDRRLIL
jgi:radical SAM superfamily enzyme YgiQ (UPF0313 family)